MSEFARRLKAVRESRGVTLYRLAQLTGLSKQGVINLEAEGSDPKLSTMILIARALEVQPWELLPGWPGSTQMDQPAFAAGSPEPARPRARQSTPVDQDGHDSEKPAGFKEAVVALLGGSRWYTTKQIVAALSEEFPGITEEQIHVALRQIRYRPPEGKQLRAKKIGRKHQYRLIKEVKRPKAGSLPGNFFEKLEEVLTDLDDMGQMTMATLTPSLVRQAAYRLRKLCEHLVTGASSLL
jgi:transcriptional regulator with XRE-family HTH domain